jgi:N-acetylglucosaminyldiphosphoundecaprenol N-acetyl-beta-D-mannosaminyltransferase
MTLLILLKLPLKAVYLMWCHISLFRAKWRLELNLSCAIDGITEAAYGCHLLANQSERLSLTEPEFRGGSSFSQENESPVRPTMLRQSDDLSREVYGVLGIPIDAIDLPGVVQRIGTALTRDTPYLISTPNLNFLVSSQVDPEFRESLLRSDLCPVDGVPIVWISRLLGAPIRERVAGSDIFDRLKSQDSRPAKIFLFGGPEGVAETASRVLNAQSNGVVCVGTLYPGYCPIEEMSTDTIIDAINASGAGFLVASLGAQKGQSWLLHNHHRLKIPVRSHLGAAINFQAGLLKRAPLFVRKFGLEWLWRIKEEPYLWSRYLADGGVLFSLMLTSVLPLVLGAVWRSVRGTTSNLRISANHRDNSCSISLSGMAIGSNVASAIPVFRDVLAKSSDLTIDVSTLRVIDARFFGLLLMIRKQLIERGGRLKFVGVSRRMERAFRMNRFGFLLPLCGASNEATDANWELGEAKTRLRG